MVSKKVSVDDDGGVLVCRLVIVVVRRGWLRLEGKWCDGDAA